MPRPTLTQVAQLAQEVLDKHWDQTLPVPVHTIAERMGAHLEAINMGQISGRLLSVNTKGNTTGKPVILSNAKDSVVRQRYAVAHELGRLALGFGTSVGEVGTNMTPLSTRGEYGLPNHFAAHLLMPASAVQRLASERPTTIEDLSHAFGVTALAMSQHIITLGLSRLVMSKQLMATSVTPPAAPVVAENAGNDAETEEQESPRERQ